MNTTEHTLHTINLHPQIIAACEGPKGAFVSLQTRRPCEMRAAFRSTPIFKVASMTVRLGVEYDNQSGVQDRRESGELPAENQGLVGKEWLVYPYIKRSLKSGKLLLATVPCRNETPVHVSYFEDAFGNRIDREHAKQICTAKEFPTRSDYIGAMDYTIENITGINGKPLE